MTKDAKEKIGRFLGLIFNLYIGFGISFVASDYLNYKHQVNDELVLIFFFIFFLIFTYPAWRWRAKPMQFLIWCFQKL